MNISNIPSDVANLGNHGLRKGTTEPTGWYQSFDFPGITTVDKSPTNVRTFRKILTLFDFPVKDLKLLDIGCNAGLHCIEASILGMSCVGAEGKYIWLDQARYTKNLYQEILGKDLDIAYVKFNLMDDDLASLGIFDYCLALGVLTEIPFSLGYVRNSPECVLQQTILLSKLHSITNNLIISTNDTPYMNIDYYKESLNGNFKLHSTTSLASKTYARFERVN